jgi:hypothetical protein
MMEGEKMEGGISHGAKRVAHSETKKRERIKM